MIDIESHAFETAVYPSIGNPSIRIGTHCLSFTDKVCQFGQLFDYEFAAPIIRLKASIFVLYHIFKMTKIVTIYNVDVVYLERCVIRACVESLYIGDCSINEMAWYGLCARPYRVGRLCQPRMY